MSVKLSTALLSRAAGIATALTAVLTPAVAVSQAAAAPVSVATHQHARAAAASEVQIKTFADKCLTIANQDYGNGARLVQYTCEGDSAQRFRLARAENNTFSILTFANKCLTVPNRDPANGVQIVQYTCEDDFAQHFTIT